MADQPEVTPAPNPETTPEPAVSPAPVPAPVAAAAPVEAPVSAPVAAPVAAPVSSHNGRTKVLFSILSVLLLAGGLGGGYTYAKSTIKPIDNTVKLPTIEVPSGATVISECAVGRGKQYIMPKDIPNGPVYNVLDNKVIGLEYMVGKDDLLNKSKTFKNLPMLSGVYNHINIGLLSNGHAGFPEPHYHVDVFLVPSAVADAITCKK